METLIYFDRNKPPEIPVKVAVCPICGAQLIIEDIDEWEAETGRVTDCGLHIDCSTEPDIDGEDWDGWFRGHWSQPYMDWLPVQEKVFHWFDARYRIKTDNTL